MSIASGSWSVSAKPCSTQVSSIGSATAPTQPATWRPRESGESSGRLRARRATSSWVTRWTSIEPASEAIRSPVVPVKSRRSRPCRETPTMIIVALVPAAKSTTAAETSSPTTEWKVPPTEATSSWARSSRRSSALCRPSVAITCTASSSAPAARWASRAPRRISVSLSGPPVTATTMRSLAGQVSWIRCARR